MLSLREAVLPPIVVDLAVELLTGVVEATVVVPLEVLVLRVVPVVGPMAVVPLKAAVVRGAAVVMA